MISAEPGLQVIVGRVAVGRMHFLSGVLLVRLVLVLGGRPVIGGRQIDWHLLFDEDRVMLNDRHRVRNRNHCLVMRVVRLVMRVVV